MERQGLLVELGRLDGAGGALDAQADERGGGDRPGADGARPAVESAPSSGSGALPGQWRWKVSATSGRSTGRRQSAWQALSLSM